MFSIGTAINTCANRVGAPCMLGGRDANAYKYMGCCLVEFFGGWKLLRGIRCRWWVMIFICS